MMLVDPNELKISNRLRKLDYEKVKELCRSIEEIGLINPVQINNRTLIAGAHRVAAFKLLGYRQIPAIEVGEVDNRDSKYLIEIDENLFRNDLTEHQRIQHIKFRVEILSKRKSNIGEHNNSKVKKNKVAISKDVITETARFLDTSPNDIKKALRVYENLSKVNLPHEDLDQLCATRLREVAKVAKKGNLDETRNELIIQLNKKNGESAISHIKNKVLAEDLHTLVKARTKCGPESKKGMKRNSASDIENKYFNDAYDALDVLIKYLRENYI